MSRIGDFVVWLEEQGDNADLNRALDVMDTLPLQDVPNAQALWAEYANMQAKRKAEEDTERRDMIDRVNKA
jgi:predicted transposase YdaD